MGPPFVRRTQPKSNGVTLRQLLSTPRKPEGQVLVQALNRIIENEDQELKILKGPDAQKMMELIQDAMDYCSPTDPLRDHLFKRLKQIFRNADVDAPAFLKLSNTDPKDMEWLHHANGGFSNIYKTPPLFPEDKSWVLKVPRCTEKSRDTKATQKAIEEFILWRQLKHENILPFLGVCEYNGIWGGVSPWMTQGDLCKYLVDNPEVDRLPLIIGIISAVKYLHVSVPHCIHRDIKPNNILIGDDGTPLLGDFGLSSVQYDYTKNITTATAGGTIMYMPPEWLLDTNTSATMSSDVYSLSVTIAEVLTGKAPYHQQQAHPIILAHRNISPFEKPFPLLKLTARDDDVKEFWRLMERCWNREAQQRPHVSDLYSWFTKLQETTSSGERVQGKRCIFIPSKNCGYLIGRNGSRVKHLQAKYKVQIRLGSNSDGDTREAEITGSPRNVALSIDQIEQILRNIPPKNAPNSTKSSKSPKPPAQLRAASTPVVAPTSKKPSVGRKVRSQSSVPITAVGQKIVLATQSVSDFDHSERIGGLGWGPIYPFLLQSSAAWSAIIERWGGSKDEEIQRRMIDINRLEHRITIHGPKKVVEKIVNDLKAKSQGYQVKGVIVPTWLIAEVEGLKEGGLLAWKKETGASILRPDSPHYIHNAARNAPDLEAKASETILKIIGSVEACMSVYRDIKAFVSKRRAECCRFNFPAKHHHYLMQQIRKLCAAHVQFLDVDDIPAHPSVPSKPGPEPSHFPWRGFTKISRYPPDNEAGNDRVLDSKGKDRCIWEVWPGPSQTKDDIESKVRSLADDAYEARRIAWIWLPIGLNCSLTDGQVQEVEDEAHCAIKLCGRDVIELCGSSRAIDDAQESLAQRLFSSWKPRSRSNADVNERYEFVHRQPPPVRPLGP